MRRIAVLLALALSAPATASAQDIWTWTLYENPGAVALANEVPDSAKLAAVLECQPGSGAAKVSIFPEGGRSRTPVTGEFKTSEAAFSAFVRSGRLSLRTQGGAGEIAMDAEHRPKLERFARLCGA